MATGTGTSSTTQKKRRGRKKVRGKGRPSNQDLTVGRDALIDKACELLSTTPPAQLTNAAVAREAGVDPSLIRYYFKTRSALLLAAFVRLTESYAGFLEEESANYEDTPEGQLCARVSALFRLTTTYPYYHDLIIEEIAPMKDPKARKVLSDLTDDRLGMYETIVETGIKEGRFRDIDTRLLFVAIIGMCHFFTKGSRIVKLAMHRDEVDTTLGEEYLNVACEILLNGIRKPA